MTTGKEFTQKAAREAIAAYFSAINPNLNYQNQTNPNWFWGTVSADRLQITEDATGIVYKLISKGFPRPQELAYKLDGSTAFVIGSRNAGQSFKTLHLDGFFGVGYTLRYDKTWIYLVKLGEDTKYYLPRPANMEAVPPPTGTSGNASLFQAKLSSDGNALIVGSVIQNPDQTKPDTYFKQFAIYYTMKNISLLSYTSEATQAFPLQGLTYPVNIDSGFNIVYCQIQDYVTGNLDLNSYSDGKVSAPSPGVDGSQGIFYPRSHANSVFSQFQPIVNQTWDADTGQQFVDQSFGVGTVFNNFDHQMAFGNQNYLWATTPNSSIYTTYTFTINNSIVTDPTLLATYDADLLISFVNGYIYGVTQVNWSEGFGDTFFQTAAGVINGQLTVTNNFDENLATNYKYTYFADYATNLRYLQSLDLWVSANPITGTQLNNSWIKNLSALQNSSYTGGGHIPFSEDGSAIFDASDPISNNQHYISQTGVLAFQPCQFAFTTEFTTGPPSIIPFLVKDIITVRYYSGIGRTFLNLFSTGGTSPNGTPIGVWPGFFIHFPAADPAHFDYMDLNWDNLMFENAFQAFTVFAGRSTMVINNLMTSQTPPIDGIITQLLGDGSDFNTLSGVFKGRQLTNDNTAYVYAQNFSGIYRYSSPYLQQGNLANIQGAGSANPDLGVGTDSYSNAIAQLVDFQSIADVYDDTALANEIAAVIVQYSNKVIPSGAALDSIYTQLIALSSDLTGSVNALKDSLNAINTVINGGNPLIIGQDVIGLQAPDVFSDKIMSLHGTFPFAFPGQTVRTLKAVDSYIVQEYYIESTTEADGTVFSNEVIQAYNIDTTGLTTLGKNVIRPQTINTDPILDFVMPLPSTATTG